MKKCQITLLLLIVMLLSVFPLLSITAKAENEVTLLIDSSVSDDSADRDNGASYKTIAGALAKAQNGDTIRLISDITENVIIPDGRFITLDLNGYVLKGTGERSVIENYGSLTIMDSNTDSQMRNFKVGSGGLWTLTEGPYMGDPLESVTSTPAENAIIAVTGGVITGGVITGNGADNGGGVINFGTFTMSGGSIIGNVAYNGGGVFNYGTFTMNGGSIAGNVALYSGGGVIFNTDFVTLGGTARIIGNTSGESIRRTDNLYLPEGKTVVIDTGDNAPTTTMAVGITTKTVPEKGSPVALTDHFSEISENIKTCFFSDNAQYCVQYTDPGILELAVSKVKIGSVGYASVGDALAADASDETALNPTTITLIDDITENVIIPEGRFITLDLNGYVLMGTGEGSVIFNIGTLTIMDSNTDSQTHNFKVGSNRLWTLTEETANAKPLEAVASVPAENDIITITGGVITGNFTQYGGGVINYGTFTMSGGSITGNSAEYGGGVYNSGSFTMNGGSITGNISPFGGGVNNSFGGDVNNNNPGSFTMNGGSITGNVAEAGGGVINARNFEMNGGSITVNTAFYFGGGVYFDTGTVTLGGTSRIIGNTSEESDKKTDNLYLPEEKTVAIGTGDNAPTTMYVGITTKTVPTQGSPVALTGSCGDFSACFFSDNVKYCVQYSASGILELVVPIVKINGSLYVSIKDALAADASDETALNPTTITLISDVTENVSIPKGRFITLDLNGYVLKGTGRGSVISNGGTLTIKDSNTDSQTHNFKVGSKGLWTLTEETDNAKPFEAVASVPAENDIITITGGVITGSSSIAGSIGCVLNSGSFTMSGGFIVGNTSERYAGGAYNSGTFTMIGGFIVGNTAPQDGGGVVNYGTFTMSGGSITFNTAKNGGGVENGGIFTMKGNSSITDNTAEYGGGVDNSGTFTMSGGSITGNTAFNGGGIYNNKGTFTMSGGGISNNTAKVAGGGVYNIATFIMSGGSIAVNTSGKSGGGVWSMSDFSMNRGSIVGNVAGESGGGVYFDTGTVTLGGSAQIICNTSGGNAGKMDNLYLRSGKTVAIGTENDAPTAMSVGVTTETVPTAGGHIAITGNNSGNFSGFFLSDQANYGIINEGSGSNQVVRLSVYTHSWTYVEALIGAIGEVEYSVESWGKIAAARSSYESLSDEEKSKVSNYSVLRDAEGSFAELESQDTPHVVLLTSRTPGGALPVAPVSGGGVYYSVRGCDITAYEREGFTFKGWYLDYGTDDEEKLGEETEFTIHLIPAKDMNITAVYEPVSGGKFSVSVYKEYNVISGKIVYYGDEDLEYSPGESVTVSYSNENRDFLYWADENGNVLSWDKEFSFTAYRSMAIFACTKAKGVENVQGIVIFESEEGELISSGMFAVSDVIVFPDAPVIAGKEFAGWSMTPEEITENLKTSFYVHVIALYNDL